MKQANQVRRAPVRDALVKHWRAILLTCLTRTGQTAPFYLFTTFLLSYGTATLKLDQNLLFTAVLVAAGISLFTTPFFGALSDRIGAIVFLAVIVSLPLHDMQYGPQAAFIAEQFPADLRCSGASLGYQLASLTAGGPAPLIAAWLVHS